MKKNKNVDGFENYLFDYQSFKNYF